MAAVIFDFDGVIADSEMLHMRALQQAFAGRGWTLSDEDYLTHYLGYDDRGVINAFCQSIGERLDASAFDALLQDKASRYVALLSDGQVLYPTAAPCIERLNQVFPLAVASGSLRGEIEHILEANHLRDRFKVIVGADDVLAGKPAPDSYQHAADALGISPAHALAIEDSPWGLQSARTAGLVCIGITTSYQAAELGDTDYVVASLDEVTVDLVSNLLSSKKGL